MEVEIMINTNIKKVIELLSQKRGFDFSAYHMSFLKKQILHHMQTIGESSFSAYLELINRQKTEMNSLADLLTVNVSKFFRDSLLFEIIASVILPELITTKRHNGHASLRLWSAGCSYGEEAYSLAILLREALLKSNSELRTELFATDIDQKALEESKQAIYGFESIENVKIKWLREFFIDENSQYKVVSEIKDMVNFSKFDLIDKKHHAPVESIFGNFDIILCRNVLIYFQKDFQEIILSNLTRSLASGGILVLGESEVLSETYQKKFKKVTNYCKIFQKVR